MIDDKIKILVVDDNRDNLIIMKALIQEAFTAATIITALSGATCLQLAEEHDPDVILLDIVMPGMDGFEVCRLLKANPLLADIPVVFVTALKGDKENRIKGLEAGAEAFLTKPVDESELIVQIRAMVKIKAGNLARKEENLKLAALVDERTQGLQELHIATLNLLEDLQNENEARRITEEALNESDALYRSILQASPDGITLTDTEGNIVMVSDAGLKLIGIEDRQQIIGTSVFNYIHRDDKEFAITTFDRIFRDNYHKSVEFKILNNLGLIIDIEVNAELIRNTNGDVKGIVLIIRDITKRKAEQRKIQESEALYRAILGASPDNICITDLNGDVQMVSPSTLKTFGLGREDEIMGSNITNFVIEKDRDALLIEITLLLTGDDSGTFEYRCQRRNGYLFDVEVRGGIIKDERGLISRLVFILRDVTDRKKAEADLEASEAKYRNLINNSPEGIMIYVDNKIAFVNNESVRLMRAGSKDDLLNKELKDFIAPENIDLVIERMKLVAEAPLYVSLPSVEEVYTRLDGTIFNVEIKPMRIIFDGKSAVQLTGRDITDRKIAERKILKSEAEFRTVWENSTNGLVLVDEYGRILRVNKAFCSIFNIAHHRVEGYTIFELTGQGQHLDIVNKFTDIFTKRQRIDIEKKHVFSNGEDRWVQIENSYLELPDERPLMLGVINDTTNRKSAEEKVKYISRLYALLGQINQAVVRTHDADTLLQKICDVAIEHGEFRLAWIGSYNKYTRIIEPRFISGMDEGYVSEAVEIINNSKTKNPPTLVALGTGELYCSNSIANDKNMASFSQPALQRGYKSLCVIPLKIRGEVYGNLNLYAAEDGFFNIEEQKLCQEIGEDINYALSAIEAEKTRKQAEDALIESENRYNTFINNNVDMIFVKDDQLRYLIVNDAMARFYNVKKHNILFKTDNEIKSSGIDLQSYEADYLTLDSEMPITVVETIRDRIFETTRFRMRLKNGKLGVGGIRHDITERKRSQDALEESRQELKTIYDNAPVMMCVLDELGNVLFHNNEFENFIKLPADQIRGKLIGNLMRCSESLNSQQGCGTGMLCKECVLRKAIESTYFTEQEYRNIEYHSVLNINGVKKTVYLLGSSSLIHSNESKKILLCLYDITARKEAEKALQKSEMFLRTFIDNAPFEIWARDMNNVGILENKVLVEKFGSIIGLKPSDSKDVDIETARFWEANNLKVMKGELIDKEVVFKRKNEIIDYHQIIFPISINDDVIGVAGFNIDITEKKRLDKALEDSQEELRNFAAHIQNVREEERIVLSREIHDDLGQILVAVKIELGMLGMKAKPSLKGEALEGFNEQYKRVVKLVENTISTSRRFMDNLRPEVLDILGFIDAFKNFISSFEERCDINCIFDTNVEKFEIESQRAVALYRILQESLNNVLKHAGATEVIVRFDVGVGNKATLEIIDNGKGFDMSSKKRINSYGLIGMKERAFLLDAELTILSEPGNGTTVKIIMPYTDDNVVIFKK